MAIAAIAKAAGTEGAGYDLVQRMAPNRSRSREQRPPLREISDHSFHSYLCRNRVVDSGRKVRLMTCACSLCGFLIFADVPTVGAPLNNTAEVAVFDLLAAKLVQHLSDRHRPQAYAMLAVQNLTSKVYAMTWAQPMPTDRKFRELRRAWRAGVLATIMEHRQADQADGEADPPVASGSAEGESS